MTTKRVLGHNLMNEPTIPQSALLMVWGVLGQKVRDISNSTTTIPQSALLMVRRRLKKP